MTYVHPYECQTLRVKQYMVMFRYVQRVLCTCIQDRTREAIGRWFAFISLRVVRVQFVKRPSEND